MTGCNQKGGHQFHNTLDSPNLAPNGFQSSQLMRQNKKDTLFVVVVINLFIYLYIFLAALGLPCCTQAFSSCGEQGLLFVAGFVVGFVAQASHCGGFSCCGARALGARAQ